eukprot:875973-Karenia_brevis.AAC.1
MRDMMREVVREEVGRDLREVKEQMEEMKTSMGEVRQLSERAGATASAAMEAVRALEAKVDKDMQSLSVQSKENIGK